MQLYNETRRIEGAHSRIRRTTPFPHRYYYFLSHCAPGYPRITYECGTRVCLYVHIYMYSYICMYVYNTYVYICKYYGVREIEGEEIERDREIERKREVERDGQGGQTDREGYNMYICVAIWRYTNRNFRAGVQMQRAVDITLLPFFCSAFFFLLFFSFFYVRTRVRVCVRVCVYARVRVCVLCSFVVRTTSRTACPLPATSVSPSRRHACTVNNEDTRNLVPFHRRTFSLCISRGRRLPRIRAYLDRLFRTVETSFRRAHCFRTLGASYTRYEITRVLRSVIPVQ